MQNIFGPSGFQIAGRNINRKSASDDPSSLFLADGIHAGTVGQALIANVFIKAMNRRFKTKVKPFSASEIVADAGLNPKNSLAHSASPIQREALHRVE